MTEIQKHFITKDGNHFVATFDNTKRLALYVPPEGAVEIEGPPTKEHRYRDGKWIIPDKSVGTVQLSDKEKLERLLGRYDLTIQQLKAILQESR